MRLPSPAKRRTAKNLNEKLIFRLENLKPDWIKGRFLSTNLLELFATVSLANCMANSFPIKEPPIPPICSEEGVTLDMSACQSFLARSFDLYWLVWHKTITWHREYLSRFSVQYKHTNFCLFLPSDAKIRLKFDRNYKFDLVIICVKFFAGTVKKYVELARHYFGPAIICADVICTYLISHFCGTCILNLDNIRSDIWNISYIELRIWNQVSHDHRSFEYSKPWSSQFSIYEMFHISLLIHSSRAH